MVWVDPLRDHGWRLGPSSHLMADTPEELHAFAERVGLRRRWFQAHPRLWHYDLTATRRERAVALGAVQLGTREAVRRARGRNGEGALQTQPDEA